MHKWYVVALLLITTPTFGSIINDFYIKKSPKPEATYYIKSIKPDYKHSPDCSYKKNNALSFQTSCSSWDKFASLVVVIASRETGNSITVKAQSGVPFANGDVYKIKSRGLQLDKNVSRSGAEIRIRINGK